MEAYSSRAVYVGECIPLTAHFEPTALLIVTLDLMHVLFVTRPSNVIRISRYCNLSLPETSCGFFLKKCSKTSLIQYQVIKNSV
jgi:hypothetical protein